MSGCQTGSSTIQHALAALAPELRCQGVHVPVAGRSPRPDGSIRHANLLRALTGVDFKPEHGAWPELAEELRESNARQFVISDEMLSRRPLEATKALADLADWCDLDVRVLGYVRTLSTSTSRPSTRRIPIWPSDGCRSISTRPRRSPADPFPGIPGSTTARCSRLGAMRSARASPSSRLSPSASREAWSRTFSAFWTSAISTPAPGPV